MQQLCRALQLSRAFVPAKRIAARRIQIGQPLVLKQQKQESLTCFIRFYLTVIVSLHQYVKNTEDREDSPDRASYNRAAETALMADLESCESYFFLLEDPEAFQSDYQILARPDGTLPEEEGRVEGPWALAWKDVPLLEAMDLGTYEEKAAGQTLTGSGRDLVLPLYLARRGFWTDKTVKNKEGCDALWNILTEGTR